jgi:hypothetical protein
MLCIYDDFMRTTLTLEPDVAERIKRRMKRMGLSLKRVVNDALRDGLAEEHRAPRVKFSVEPHSCRFKAGIDLDKLNQLVDELAAEESVKSLSR